MEKLVRDKIPELMREAGARPRFRQAPPQERLGLLLQKLQEEVQELAQTPCIEECADVLEVIVALAEELGASQTQLFAAASHKAEVRGRFQMGYVLELEE